MDDRFEAGVDAQKAAKQALDDIQRHFKDLTPISLSRLDQLLEAVRPFFGVLSLDLRTCETPVEIDMDAPVPNARIEPGAHVLIVRLDPLCHGRTD